MRKQYTRIYINPNTGEIDHLYTQDTPIITEPIRSDSINYATHDFIIEHNEKQHIKAKELLPTMTFNNGTILISDNRVLVK